MKSSEISAICRDIYLELLENDANSPPIFLETTPGWNDLTNQQEIVDDLHKWRDEFKDGGAEVIHRALKRAYGLNDDQARHLTKYIAATC